MGGDWMAIGMDYWAANCSLRVSSPHLPHNDLPRDLPLSPQAAAAKSMEAAYDVMAEAAEDGKKREAALRSKLDAAEAALSVATARLEREQAAAKSIEAAYDVMAEAVEDGKKREAELRRQLNELQPGVEAEAEGRAEEAEPEGYHTAGEGDEGSTP